MNYVELANGIQIDTDKYSVDSHVIISWYPGHVVDVTLTDEHIVLFNDQGEIEDIAENWETASSIINQNSGAAGYVVNNDHVTFMDVQGMCDREHDARVDCFGE